MAIVDAHSFWVVGYFEETKLRHIRVGDSAQVALMGYDPVLTGHVESIGHGIGDNNDETGGLGLPDVEPTFSWVRLAQRVPVRIHIDTLPKGLSWWRACRRAWRWDNNLGIVSLKHICETYRF